MSYGEKIAALRKRKGMTQSDLGKELNVTFQAVSKWERNESEPDFATMSKMAKMFGVSLSYFEEEGEPPEVASTTDAAPAGQVPATDSASAGVIVPEAQTSSGTAQAASEEQKSLFSAPGAPVSQGATPAATAREMVGVCTECGKALYSGEEQQDNGKLYCISCMAKRRARRSEMERSRVAAHAAVARDARKSRTKGFIFGSIAAAAGIFAAIMSGIFVGEGAKEAVAAWLVIAVLLFFTVSQLFWDGIVASIAGIGGHVIGTPGVIFTLDFDGIIFLVAVKILFAVLRFLVYIITFLFFFVIAMLVSPFSFAPALVRLHREIV